MRLAAAPGLVLAMSSAALAGYQLNDRVQAYVSGVWYDGTIVGLGDGDFVGEFYVQFDKGDRSYYVNPDNLRALPQGTPAGPAIPGVAFTPGVYECVLGDQYFDLKLGSNLVYQQTVPEAEQGTYELDSATGIIRFVTGPYSIGQWTAQVRGAAAGGGVVLHADRDYDCRGPR